MVAFKPKEQQQATLLCMPRVTHLHSGPHRVNELEHSRIRLAPLGLALTGAAHLGLEHSEALLHPTKLRRRAALVAAEDRARVLLDTFDALGEPLHLRARSHRSREREGERR